MNEKHDVFISYSSKDKDVAFYLCDKIEEQGIKCWIAPRNEIAGMTYARQILQAIENSYVVLVCFSTNANTSEHVESEVDIAYCAGKVIIPFRIDECEMSAGLRYYLNKKHWLNGIPVNEQAVEKLISSIIVNIPEYAKLHEMERSIDNAMVVVSNLVSESEDLDTAVSMQNNDSIISRFDKLKQLYNSIQKLEENLMFGSVIKNFIEEDLICLNDSPKGGSRYDLLANAMGELILITSSLKGSPNESSLVYDESVGNILLKKNEECAVRLESISQEVFSYLKKNEKILIVEVDDENLSVSVTNEYYATIKDYSTNNLPHTHKLTKEQISNNPENRFDILFDKEGGVTIVISAMEGAPNNCRGIYDDKKLLIFKNQGAVRICDNLNAKAIEALTKVEIITIIETFKGEPVAEYEVRIFSKSQAHKLTKEQISDNPENGFDFLCDKEGRVAIIISAMEGVPNNCRGIYDDKKLLIFKNQEAAIICDNLNAKAIEALTKVETITIIETYRGEPVAEYDMRIFSTDYITI